MKIAIFALLCFAACAGLTGCSFLAGTGKAMEAYEATKADVEKARGELDKLTKELTDIKTEYDAAVKAGDVTKAGALLNAGQQALLRWEQAKAAFDASKTALENAIKRVQDSKNTEDYLGNIFGVLLGGVAGSGVVGGWLGTALKNLKGAVRVTANNADTHVPESEWAAFTKAQREGMTPAQQAAFNAAAGL